MIERRTIGRKFDAEIKMYEVSKYKATEEDFNNAELLHYEDAVSWEIITGFEAAEFENEFDVMDEDKDEFGEYLRLNFEDGTTATMANSRCDMFITKYK